MNLYLLSQDDRRGYDTYDSVVVAAESEAEARLITPGFRGFDDSWRSSDWARAPELVAVELIGVAVPGTEAGVILSSFNAG